MARRRFPPRDSKGRFVKRGRKRRRRSPSRRRRSPRRKVRRTSKPSMVTKLINGGLLALAFARPLQKIFSGEFGYFTQRGGQSLIAEATFGLGSESGGFDKNAGLRLYGPMGGAFILKKAISKLRRTIRI